VDGGKQRQIGGAVRSSRESARRWGTNVGEQPHSNATSSDDELGI
jgi:hypothetical protein